MPTLDQHSSTNLAKILAVGDSGTAKTGSLASLALAGYRLNIADFDNGLDVIVGMLKDHPDWKAIASRIDYETFTDTYGDPKATGRYAPKTGDAFSRGLKWIAEKTSEGPDSWLVIDSLTRFCDRAMDRTLALTGRLGQQPQLQEWGAAMADIEAFLGLMASAQVTCNTIMFAHKTYVEGDDGVAVPYPRALGSKLPPKVPSFFNTMIGYVVAGSGENVKREIVTTPYRGLGFKTPAPTKVKSKYLLDPKTPEKGLIDFVRDIGVAGPQ